MLGWFVQLLHGTRSVPTTEARLPTPRQQRHLPLDVLLEIAARLDPATMFVSKPPLRRRALASLKNTHKLSWELRITHRELRHNFRHSGNETIPNGIAHVVSSQKCLELCVILSGFPTFFFTKLWIWFLHWTFSGANRLLLWLLDCQWLLLHWEADTWFKHGKPSEPEQQCHECASSTLAAFRVKWLEGRRKVISFFSSSACQLNDP
jgi:hypothetical protein